MKKYLFVLILAMQTPLFASELEGESSWHSLERPHVDNPAIDMIALPYLAGPMLTLEQSRYDLRILDNQAIGTITLAGNVLVDFPEPMQLFGHEIAVLDIIASENALLLASDGAYEIYPGESGIFLLMLAVSIPVIEFEMGPRLGFEVPAAVRNELVLEAPEHLRLLDSEILHRVGDRYYFAPTRFLDLGFEHLDWVGEDLPVSDQLQVQLRDHDACPA